MNGTSTIGPDLNPNDNSLVWLVPLIIVLIFFLVSAVMLYEFSKGNKCCGYFWCPFCAMTGIICGPCDCSLCPKCNANPRIFCENCDEKIKESVEV